MSESKSAKRYLNVNVHEFAQQLRTFMNDVVRPLRDVLPNARSQLKTNDIPKEINWIITYVCIGKTVSFSNQRAASVTYRYVWRYVLPGSNKYDGVWTVQTSPNADVVNKKRYYSTDEFLQWMMYDISMYEDCQMAIVQETATYNHIDAEEMQKNMPNVSSIITTSGLGQYGFSAADVNTQPNDYLWLIRRQWSFRALVSRRPIESDSYQGNVIMVNLYPPVPANKCDNEQDLITLEDVKEMDENARVTLQTPTKQYYCFDRGALIEYFVNSGSLQYGFCDTDPTDVRERECTPFRKLPIGQYAYILNATLERFLRMHKDAPIWNMRLVDIFTMGRRNPEAHFVSEAYNIDKGMVYVLEPRYIETAQVSKRSGQTLT